MLVIIWGQTYQVKCECYWSEEVGEAVEVEEADLKAITTSITNHRDFVIRTMNLKKVSHKTNTPCVMSQGFP